MPIDKVKQKQGTDSPAVQQKDNKVLPARLKELKPARSKSISLAASPFGIGKGSMVAISDGNNLHALKPGAKAKSGIVNVQKESKVKDVSKPGPPKWKGQSPEAIARREELLALSTKYDDAFEQLRLHGAKDDGEVENARLRKGKKESQEEIRSRNRLQSADFDMHKAQAKLGAGLSKARDVGQQSNKIGSGRFRSNSTDKIDDTNSPSPEQLLIWQKEKQAEEIAERRAQVLAEKKIEVAVQKQAEINEASQGSLVRKNSFSEQRQNLAKNSSSPSSSLSNSVSEDSQAAKGLNNDSSEQGQGIHKNSSSLDDSDNELRPENLRKSSSLDNGSNELLNDELDVQNDPLELRVFDKKPADLKSVDTSPYQAMIKGTAGKTKSEQFSRGKNFAGVKYGLESVAKFGDATQHMEASDTNLQKDTGKYFEQFVAPDKHVKPDSKGLVFGKGSENQASNETKFDQKLENAPSGSSFKTAAHVFDSLDKFAGFMGLLEYFGDAMALYKERSDGADAQNAAQTYVDTYAQLDAELKKGDAADPRKVDLLEKQLRLSSVKFLMKAKAAFPDKMKQLEQNAHFYKVISGVLKYSYKTVDAAAATGVAFDSLAHGKKFYDTLTDFSLKSASSSEALNAFLGWAVSGAVGGLASMASADYYYSKFKSDLKKNSRYKSLNVDLHQDTIKGDVDLKGGLIGQASQAKPGISAALRRAERKGKGVLSAKSGARMSAVANVTRAISSAWSAVKVGAALVATGVGGIIAAPALAGGWLAARAAAKRGKSLKESAKWGVAGTAVGAGLGAVAFGALVATAKIALVATAAAGMAAFMASPVGLAVGGVAAGAATAAYIYKAVRHRKHASAKNQRKAFIATVNKLGRLADDGVNRVRNKAQQAKIDVSGDKFLSSAIDKYNKSATADNKINAESFAYADLISLEIVDRDSAYSADPQFDLRRVGGDKDWSAAADTLDKLKDSNKRRKNKTADWMGAEQVNRFRQVDLASVSLSQMAELYEGARLDLIGRDSMPAAEEVYNQLINDYKAHLAGGGVDANTITLNYSLDNAKVFGNKDAKGKLQRFELGKPSLVSKADGADLPFSDSYRDSRVDTDKIRNGADFLHAMGIGNDKIRTLIQSAIDPKTGTEYNPADLVDTSRMSDHDAAAAIQNARKDIAKAREDAIKMIKKECFG